MCFDGLYMRLDVVANIRAKRLQAAAVGWAVLRGPDVK